MLKKKLSIETAAMLLIFLFFLGFALSVNLPEIYNGFLTADQAVYFAMSQSIAYDLDVEYTKKDLIRYYDSFRAGPQGIFLRRVATPAGDKLYYAKSFAYPLFAAPFVRVFGTNGPLVFHAVLLLLLLLMGRAFLAGKTGPPFGLIFPLTFLFASIAWIYALWITPDFFNLTLVFSVLFLWLYKIKLKGNDEHLVSNVAASTDGSKIATAYSPAPGGPSSRLHAFLLSGKSDCLAAFLAGIAVYSKPPNIALMGPIVLYAILKKNYLRTALILLFFIISVAIFYGATYLQISDWNFQGGERKTFAGSDNFPLARPEFTFDTLGWTMSTKGYSENFMYPLKIVPPNLFYYFFGRFNGVAWYYFPALLGLILFAFARRRIEDWLLLIALSGSILMYIVFMPDNFGGGGGSLANRYFLNIYPFFFFLPSRRKAGRETAAAWIVASIFLAQISLAPFAHSRLPATHAKRFPFKLLPVELSQVNNFPTNTRQEANRVNIWNEPQEQFLHFLNDNFYPRLEPDGIWTRGDKTCEFLLKTYYPVKELQIRLLNNPRKDNRITVTVEGRTQKITLQPKLWGTLKFPVGDGFVMRAAHIYKLKIRASKESTPYFEDTSSDERRDLGVFFSIDIIRKDK